MKRKPLTADQKKGLWELLIRLAIGLAGVFTGTQIL